MTICSMKYGGVRERTPVCIIFPISQIFDILNCLPQLLPFYLCESSYARALRKRRGSHKHPQKMQCLSPWCHSNQHLPVVS